MILTFPPHCTHQLQPLDDYLTTPLFNLPSSLLWVLASLVCISPPDSEREDEDAILPAPMDVVTDVHIAPDIDREATMRVLKACSPTSIVSDVSTPGKTRTRTNRTRVLVTSAVVTSSPY